MNHAESRCSACGHLCNDCKKAPDAKGSVRGQEFLMRCSDLKNGGFVREVSNIIYSHPWFLDTSDPNYEFMLVVEQHLNYIEEHIRQYGYCAIEDNLLDKTRDEVDPKQMDLISGSPTDCP